MDSNEKKALLAEYLRYEENEIDRLSKVPLPEHLKNMLNEVFSEDLEEESVENIRLAGQKQLLASYLQYEENEIERLRKVPLPDHLQSMLEEVFSEELDTDNTTSHQAKAEIVSFPSPSPFFVDVPVAAAAAGEGTESSWFKKAVWIVDAVSLSVKKHYGKDMVRVVIKPATDEMQGRFAEWANRSRDIAVTIHDTDGDTELAPVLAQGIGKLTATGSLIQADLDLTENEMEGSRLRICFDPKQ